MTHSDPISTHDHIIELSHVERYERGLGEVGVRTARAAAAIGISQCPEDVLLAVAGIRNKVAEGFVCLNHDFTPASTLGGVKQHYWDRASRVGEAHGAMHDTLADYLNVSESRSYENIHADLKKELPPESIAAFVLHAIDSYHTELGINPATAAHIVAELMSRGIREMTDAATAKVQSGFDRFDASSDVMKTFLVEKVRDHIDMLRVRFGYNPGHIVAVMNKRSFYPEFATGETADDSLIVSEQEGQDITKVLMIQNRPYTREQLRMAHDLANDDSMQLTLLNLHELLVAQCEKYLGQHPERAAPHMLTSWSEVFVSEIDPVTKQTTYLPNPKLLRAISNNILPAIASRLIERGACAKDLLSPEDINTAIKIASRDFKLFQSSVAFLRHNKATEGFELEAIPMLTCPANKHLPDFLTNNFANLYEQAHK